MAFSPITGAQIQVGKAVVRSLFQKIKDNLDDLDSRVTSLSTGSAPIEVFNLDVANASSASSLTGLLHHRCLSAMTISKVTVEIFEKGVVTSGTLTVDIKKNTTLDNTGMTSILSTLPSINFSTASDFDSVDGVLNPTQQNVNANDVLRLDITSLPTIPLSKFRITVYGVL